MSLHPLFAPHTQILKALAGHDLRAVGGAVRRVVRGEDLRGVELDLCTPSLPQAILASAAAAGLPTHTQGLRWGSVKVKGTDITTLRTETYPPGSRYPIVTFTTDWAADAARRDFTANAIYLAPDGTMTDPYQGQSHLQRGELVWVEDPHRKLAEDPLRWWRWLRFAAAYSPDLILEPHWASPGGTLHSIPLDELAELAAAGQGALSRPRLEQEKRKFSATKHAEALRSNLAQALAHRPALLARLRP